MDGSSRLECAITSTPPGTVDDVVSRIEKARANRNPTMSEGQGFQGSNCLHTFSDASESAYAASIYVRHENYCQTITARLVGSKTRLAPLKAMGISRLELIGALIGLRLTKQTCSALRIPMECVSFWVDSLNVVFWIQGQSRDYKPVVSHRTGEIHEHSNPGQWRYVPTKRSPADHDTRGLTVSELAECDLWWNGPKFLLYPESEWPKRKSSKPSEALKEVKCERRAVEQPTTQLPDEEIDQEDSSDSTFVQPTRTIGAYIRQDFPSGIELDA